MSSSVFHDRRDGGRQLAVHVARLVDDTRAPHTVFVLGLPRGGVPVADEVARLLGAPLDILPVRKLGMPAHEEYAMGAIAAVDGEVLQALDLTLLQREPTMALLLDHVVGRETIELRRRQHRYRGDRPALQLAGRDVVLIDDGIATGWTMLAAVRAAREAHAHRIIVAAPVGAAEACARLRDEADACVCVVETRALHTVGRWYVDFAPTTDAEVITLLEAADRRQGHRLAVGSP